MKQIAMLGSTGLGLTLSRESALRHGGDLRLVESVPGRTTFELELPLTRPKSRN